MSPFFGSAIIEGRFRGLLLKIEYLTYAPKSATNPHKIVLASLLYTNPALGPKSLPGSVHKVQLLMSKGGPRIGEAIFEDELKEYPHINATPQDVVSHSMDKIAKLRSDPVDVLPDGKISRFFLGRIQDPNVTADQMGHIRVHFENQKGQCIWSEEVGLPQVHRGRFEGPILTGEADDALAPANKAATRF